jgi:DegV family protein with EDD domain
MRIRISSDSTCDLSPELVARNDVSIIPLHIVKDGTPLRDGTEITPDDIYRHVAAGGDICATVAVNLAEYVEYFTALLRGADAVIHFCISSEMSSCYQNACLAARQVGGVWVIDSRNLSTGIGHLVLDAAAMAAQGLEPPEICAELERLRGRLDVSFVLDTLEYMKKGGRCSAMTAFGANLLHLKPSIQVADGSMGVARKYRGTLSHVLEEYVADKLAQPETVDPRRIFITDSGVPEALRDEVEQAVRARVPFREVYHTRAGCTVSSHCGPNCLGILFYRR